MLLLAAGCSERETALSVAGESTPISIESIKPSKGPSGTEIIIAGSGFSEHTEENEVTLNGTPVALTSSTTRFLKGTVPKGAGTGPIELTIDGKTITGPSFSFVPTIRVSTFAGTGEIGFRDGESAEARFNYPVGLELTDEGELIVVDYWNHSIRVVSPEGYVSTLAGNPNPGSRDGAADMTRFFRPIDVEVDKNGNVFISDFGNHRIRRITPGGKVTTIAGSSQGYRNGLADTARFSYPAGIAIDDEGNLLVSDSENNRIRKISTGGEVSTIAGSGSYGFENGFSELAEFRFPFGIDFGNEGRIFIADYGNNSIRLISSAKVVSTFSGNGVAGFLDGESDVAQYDAPYDVTVDNRNRIYVADFDNHRIRRISPRRTVTNIAGTGQPGFVNGDETQAQFNSPIGLAVNDDGTVLYVADHKNHVIRKVTIE
ncbi:MAG: IPT/TIG domain-containing protein [Balneolaceae bacterium]|nr:IPT/TIG domain-containing protein [Balneolaceae bacterium]